MKIAHIVPPQWGLKYAQGDYRMALAHWLKTDDSGVYELTMTKGCIFPYLLLDNGAFEKEQVNTDYLALAARVLKANEVVLPDVPGEWKETLKASQKALGRFSNLNVGFAPQGHSSTEQIKCLKAWMDYWGTRDQFLTICLPSLRDKDGKSIPGSKSKTLEAAAKYNKPIHILGIADVDYFANELLPLARELNVRGIDSSLAFALGARGILLTPQAPKHRLGNPLDYDKLSCYQQRLIVLNQEILAGWVATGVTKLSETTIRQVSSCWQKYWAKGFCPLKTCMKTCGMPEGRYELIDDYVRQLGPGEVLSKPASALEIII